MAPGAARQLPAAAASPACRPWVPKAVPSCWELGRSKQTSAQLRRGARPVASGAQAEAAAHSRAVQPWPSEAASLSSGSSSVDQKNQQEWRIGEPAGHGTQPRAGARETWVLWGPRLSKSVNTKTQAQQGPPWRPSRLGDSWDRRVTDGSLGKGGRET